MSVRNGTATSGHSPARAATDRAVAALAPRQPRAGDGLIYLVMEDWPAENRWRPVKMGWTGAADPGARLASGQTFNPRKIVLMATVPGGKPHEQWLHRQWAPSRVAGGSEWFMVPGEFVSFIRRHRTSLTVARIVNVWPYARVAGMVAQARTSARAEGRELTRLRQQLQEARYEVTRLTVRLGNIRADRESYRRSGWIEGLNALRLDLDELEKRGLR